VTAVAHGAERCAGEAAVRAQYRPRRHRVDERIERIAHREQLRIRNVQRPARIDASAPVHGIRRVGRVIAAAGERKTAQQHSDERAQFTAH
jgi:hypothetical protein